jgi:DNA-binding protein H-NS
MPRKANSGLRLNSMSVSELAYLRDRIDELLASKVEAERSQLQARLSDLANLVASGSTAKKQAQPKGSTRSSKRSMSHPLRGRKAKPKYRGPNGETWAGRGLTPKWLADLEAKGKSRTSFLIK